jgi:hypothetical protein
LALIATIETARAGAAGKGFAVDNINRTSLGVREASERMVETATVSTSIAKEVSE